MNEFEEMHPEAITQFLITLAQTGIIKRACEAAGFSVWTYRKMRDEDPDFAAKVGVALSAGLIMLEGEAHRRAFEGHQKPVIHQGELKYQYEPVIDEKGDVVLDEISLRPKMQLVLDANGKPKPLTVFEYSDALTMFLLKAHDPKYRDKQDVNHTGGIKLVVTTGVDEPGEDLV